MNRAPGTMIIPASEIQEIRTEGGHIALRFERDGQVFFVPARCVVGRRPGIKQDLTILGWPDGTSTLHCKGKK